MSKICSRCILPDSFPRISFNEKGVCSICNEYDSWVNDQGPTLSEKRVTLEKICTKAKKLHREFDALIPFSGGKDSSFVLYYAKKKLDLNCLAYTFDNGFLSDCARRNVDKIIEKLGVEHVYYRFNPELMDQLYALFVRKTGYPCSACMRGIGVGINKIAELYDIPLIIQGTSLRTELPLSREMAETGILSHVRAVLKDETISIECKRLLSSGSLQRRVGYALFRLSGRKRLVTYAWFNLADYINWDYNSLFDTIKKELDWESTEETEHMDCEIHSIQNYIQIRRYPDLDLEKLKLARLIMAGQMSRQEAIQSLEKPRTQYSKEALNMFLSRIKMSKEEFDSYIDMGPRHLQYNSTTFFEEILSKVFSSSRTAKY